MQEEMIKSLDDFLTKDEHWKNATLCATTHILLIVALGVNRNSLGSITEAEDHVAGHLTALFSQEELGPTRP